LLLVWILIIKKIYKNIYIKDCNNILGNNNNMWWIKNITIYEEVIDIILLEDPKNLYTPNRTQQFHNQL